MVINVQLMVKYTFVSDSPAAEDEQNALTLLNSERMVLNSPELVGRLSSVPLTDLAT